MANSYHPENHAAIDAAIKEKAANIYSDFNSSPIDVLVQHGDAPVVVRGEPTVIAGTRKSFKSHLVAHLIGAALGGDPNRCLGFHSPQSSLRVLSVDTEQGANIHKQMLRLARRCAGLDDCKVDNAVLGYNGKKDDPQVLRGVIDELVRTHRPDIVVIDGVADLVPEINSYEESAKVVGWLLALAEEYNCAIIAVIHYNPSPSTNKDYNKERGHLGTILGNKTYGYIGLNRKPGKPYVTVSSAGRSRGKDFQDFQVMWDDKADTIKVANSHAKNTKKDEAKQDNSDTIREIMISHPDGLRRSDIMRAVLDRKGLKTKNKTQADRIINDAIAQGVIRKQSDDRFAPYILAVEPVDSAGADQTITAPEEGVEKSTYMGPTPAEAAKVKKRPTNIRTTKKEHSTYEEPTLF